MTSMTALVHISLVEAWLDRHVEHGQTTFTVTQIWKAIISLFPDYDIGRRMALQICRQYVSLVGITPERRMRGNISEYIFTPEQTRQILVGVHRWCGGGGTYEEIFSDLHDQLSGVPGRSRAITSSVGIPDTPQLSQLLSEVRALREEVRQGESGILAEQISELRSEVAALRELLRSSGVSLTETGGQTDISLAAVRSELVALRAEVTEATRGSDVVRRGDLWRVVLGVMGLSVVGGRERLPRLLAYLGVSDPEQAVAQMEELDLLDYLGD